MDQEFPWYRTSLASGSEYLQNQSLGIELGLHKKKVGGETKGKEFVGRCRYGWWWMVGRIGYRRQRWGSAMLPTG